MMNDGYRDPYQEESGPSVGRWLVFGLILILGVIGVIGISSMVPLETIPLSMVFYIPLVVFGLYATFRWAQGKTIVPTNIAEDDRILASMRKHALPARMTPHSDTLRCENCGNQFSLENALPVDTDVVLCPFCNSRLHVT
jgi:DNA-directed RNA polymerase subunit RPC12/RpoP